MLLARLKLQTRAEKSVFAIGLVLITLLVLHIFHYDDSQFKSLLEVSGYPLKIKSTDMTNKFLFPAGFQFDKNVVNTHMQNVSCEDWGLIRMRTESVQPQAPFPVTTYKPHSKFSLYAASALRDENLCDADADVIVDTLKVSERLTIHTDIRQILEHIIESSPENPYYRDLEDLLARHVREELAKDFIEPFWYRQSGSSVWLKDHNVHYVVSQLIFTTAARKTDPLVSLTLAQVFDANWNELKNVRLIFPTNSVDGQTAPVFTIGSQSFTLQHFPSILPIPFYHDYGKKNGHKFGPEDPKVMLVKNPDGYEEPLISFSAEHVKSEKKEDSKDKETNQYRSMFFTLPFQLQKGKGNLKRNKKADDIWFAKTKEVYVKGDKRQSDTRGWTPMLTSFGKSGLDEYDESVLFVALLDPLKIVRCNLYSTDESCYKVFNAGGSASGLISGTPFMNVKTLINSQHPEFTERIFPPGREVFVGIANSGLTDCGCGLSFHRPSIVAITKDQASYYDHKRKEERTKYYYKISHVSSALDLGVQVGADLKNPKEICQDINSLVPVGIGAWTIHGFNESLGAWNVDDTLSLGFSVLGNSVDQVSIKGVLNSVLNTYGNTIFYGPHALQEEQYIGFPQLDKEGTLLAALPGFSSSNVNCALDTSREYCSSYGETEKARVETMTAPDTSGADEQLRKQLEEFRNNLDSAQEEKQ